MTPFIQNHPTHSLALFYALLIALLLPSCGIVSTAVPLGHTTAIQAKDYDGVWIPNPEKSDHEEKGEKFLEQGVCIVKVISPQKGEMKILSVDSETLETETFLFTLCQINTLMIGNMYDPDSKQWIPLLAKRIGDHQLALRLFDATAVREALGLKPPQKTKKATSPQAVGFTIKNDGLELTKAQTQQFVTWLENLPKDKQKREKILSQITSEKDEQMIITHRLQLKFEQDPDDS